VTPPGAPGDRARGDLHGRPTAVELVDAVAALLRDVLPEHLEGALRHQVRIAVNALEMVSRELTLGPAQAADHQARLAALGVPDDRALADAIRAGEIDTGDRRLRQALRDDTRDRLLVANPRWLPPGQG
jgi:Domain of unknown function (DUF6285)